MERVHHSEDMVYFDQFRDGWLSLYTRQRVAEPQGARSDSNFHSSELRIQLPGVPVDLGPFLDLCRYTGNELADFNYIHERRTHTRRLERPIRLQIVGVALQAYQARKTDRWIVGLIAQNPFYGRKRLPRELLVDEFAPKDLLQLEYLLCDLRDQLELGDVVDRYELEGIETTQADHAQIIRPFGTWNKLIRSAGDGKNEAQLRGEAKSDLDLIVPDFDRLEPLRPAKVGRRKTTR